MEKKLFLVLGLSSTLEYFFLCYMLVFVPGKLLQIILMFAFKDRSLPWKVPNILLTYIRTGFESLLRTNTLLLTHKDEEKKFYSKET